METSRHFYAQLKPEQASVSKLFRKNKSFHEVPQDWHVVVADVENSTESVANGLHNNVNLAATGSVATVLNMAKLQLISEEVPYFFGGDGVTFLIHEEYLASTLKALANYRKHVKDNLQLSLRVGSMPVAAIYEKGQHIRVAKCKLNAYLSIPIVLGNGLKFAERAIKENFLEDLSFTAAKPVIDLTGMECRWDEIAPRNEDHKVVCLLVHCADEEEQPAVYADIMETIVLVFGNLKERQPITVSRLKLKATLSKIRKEMTARLGKNDMTYLLKNWLITYFGTFYFKFFKEGKLYLSKVSQLSDTIMFDGTLNTVMEGSASQIETLTNYLDLLEREGRIHYGIHSTYASVMSCYVQDRKDNHIHFVDATEGGYTSAAVIFKNKLQLDTLEAVLA